MSLHLVTRPQREPLSISDLRNHLKIGDDVEDGSLLRLSRQVRSRGERVTRRAFLTQTWDQYLDDWPDDGQIVLPKPPLQSVTFVKYVDTAGVTQTWTASDYRVDTPSGDYCARGRIALAYATPWPIALAVSNAIQVRFVCGYGDRPEDVPDLLIGGMLLDAGSMFEVRAAVATGSRLAAITIPSMTPDIYRGFRSLA
jgi:uncharacterized phiE125 gp8 family phage protein